MNGTSKIEQFREQLSDRLLLIAAIVSIPAAIFSAIRIFSMGVKPLFIADIIISLILIIAYINRKKIQFGKRMLWLILCVVILGSLALFTWGLFGLGFFILFFACVLMTTLFGLRYGLYLLGFTVIEILFFTLCVHFHLISWNVDFNLLSQNTYQWVARLVFYMAFSSIAVVTLGLVYKNLENINKEISESENRFRSLFESANDAIFILDKNSIVDCNSKTLELFNVGKEQVVGLGVHELSPLNQPDGQNSRLKAIGLINATLEGNSQRFEWKHLKADKTLFDVEVSLNRIELNKKLFVQAVVRDITDRKLFEQRVLSAELESEERERFKLAGDLHDEVGPLLSSLNMYLSLIEREQTENKKEILQTMQSILKDTITSVREISNNLSPHILNNYGLIAATNAMVDSKRMLIQINFEETLGTYQIPKTLEVICYRIVKELLNNTLKYANAKTANIKILRDNNQIQLIYDDDGVGFDSDNLLSHEHSGIGLLNIINKLNTIKATYSIFSKPGMGFRFEMKYLIANVY